MTMTYLQPVTFNFTEIINYYDYEDGAILTDGEIQLLVIVCIAITVSLFGMAGNGTVIWYLVFRVPKNHITVYILNLAIADFLFLLLFSFAVLFTVLHESGVITQDLSGDITTEFALFGYATSQYLLTAISLERCLSIVYPIWYRYNHSKHQSTILCVFLWVFSFVMMIARFDICDEQHSCKIVYILQAVLNFLIFLPLMLLSNMILIMKIWRSSRRRNPPRLYILIIITVFAFLFLSVPLSLIFFLHQFGINSTEYSSLALLSCCINSTINPVIYFLVGRFRRRHIRDSVSAALKSALLDESEASHC
ncbi:mas-related G-protein coupled receptor member H-like [Lissotriton helveticus]